MEYVVADKTCLTKTAFTRKPNKTKPNYFRVWGFQVSPQANQETYM